MRAGLENRIISVVVEATEAVGGRQTCHTAIRAGGACVPIEPIPVDAGEVYRGTGAP